MLEQNEVNVDNSEELNHIEDKEVGKSMKPKFIDTLKASLIDLIVIGAITTALVFIGDLILRLTGYFVTQKFQMSFIIFMVVMVLYTSIMESGKTSTTLGKRISGLIITKA